MVDHINDTFYPIDFTDNSLTDENLPNYNNLSNSIYILDTDINQFCLNNNKNLTLIHLNARSLNKNFPELTNLLSLINNNISAVCVTETWLNKINENNFQIAGYQFFSNCRVHKSGGGVGIYVDINLESDLLSQLIISTDIIESVFVQFQQPNCGKILIGAIY